MELSEKGVRKLSDKITFQVYTKNRKGGVIIEGRYRELCRMMKLLSNNGD
jgi:hypothetical protein